MFVIVIIMSAVIGSLILLDVSLITLIIGVSLWIFTFLYAVIVAPIAAIFYVLTGNGAEGYGVIQNAKEIVWSPLKWAVHLIHFMWARLGNYIGQDDNDEQERQTTAGKRDNDEAKGILVIAAIVNAVLLIVLAANNII